MCDAELIPETVEHTTDEDGMKRVGFIEGEEPKMSPLPQDKDKEKEEEEKAIKAMESLNLKDEAPKEDGDPGGQEKEDEEEDDDVNNGADFDVVVASEVEPLLPTPSKSVLEAESAAEGDAQLVPVAKPKAKPDRPLATVVSPDAMASLRGFLRGPLLIADGGDSDSVAPAPAKPYPLLLHLFVHHSSVAAHELLRSHGEDHNPRLTKGRVVIAAAPGLHLKVSSLLVQVVVV